MYDSSAIRDPWESADDFADRLKLRSGIKFSRLITYRTDAVLDRTYTPKCAGTVTEHCGTVGNKPSRRSLQRLVFLLNNCDVPMQSMLTLTIQAEVSRRNPVATHKLWLSNALQRLRDRGTSQYCWVREFQDETRSVHFHVFTDDVVGEPGGVDVPSSKDWSRWTIKHYQRHGWISDSAAAKMIATSYDGFVGCCRVEQLKSNAGGRYAGKEGGKRYQKVAPKRWRNSGRWWAASRNVICTPTGEKKIHGRYLERTTVEVNGELIEVPHRIQFNKGMNLS